MQKHDLKSSAQSRGKRLKSLRMLADLSRKALEKQYQISASTIQSWEDGKAGGLTEKGALRVTAALRNEGVQCSTEWLLYGAGMGPQLTDKDYLRLGESLSEYEIKTPTRSEDDAAIMQELLIFRIHNQNTIDMIVIDDTMAPHYNIGDYVGGEYRTQQEIDTLINQDCIIETINGEIMLRRLKKGAKEETYSLHGLNPYTSQHYPTIYDVKLISAAPVIWHRRKDIQK